MNSLYQKERKELRSYKIKKNGLLIEWQIDGRFKSFIMPFEKIGFNKIITSKEINPFELGLFISVFFNLMLVLLLLSDWLVKLTNDEIITSTLGIGISAGLTVWAIGLFKRKKELTLEGIEKLFFLYDKKHEDEVDKFVESLRSKQREYIRKRYMKIDDLNNKENQEYTFRWLFESEFISRDELELMLNELENRKIIKGS
ncbi:hypothetical protein [Sunxiuqinia elliptica]|uniref:Uncharacterized protein n=1 Tax=Sunxiuqinia elliptica TaxID=655355 RepID=A0A4R6GWB3_9BACT|nr:hypothetical protein [Sunxiuqinia elliptica]TDN99799.1 hypothetical protein DET52_1068 [Sunxiuqinia elliptica]TDO56991.1 hypothetical protein DET65_3573 [Sunxiuqinia elliptica]